MMENKLKDALERFMGAVKNDLELIRARVTNIESSQGMHNYDDSFHVDMIEEDIEKLLEEVK